MLHYCFSPSIGFSFYRSFILVPINADAALADVCQIEKKSTKEIAQIFWPNFFPSSICEWIFPIRFAECL